jgi:hypothetical protein
MVSKYVGRQMIASSVQVQLGVNGQELRPCGAMRESTARKDVNTEAEESTALEPLPGNDC